MPTKPVKYRYKDQSRILGDIWHDMLILAVSPQSCLFNTVNCGYWTEFHQNETQCRVIHAIKCFEVRIAILQSVSEGIAIMKIGPPKTPILLL